MANETGQGPERGTSALLDRILSEILLERGPDATVDVGELVDRLAERAYGLVLLILALPCCLPFIYGIPQMVALPMLVVTGQMAFGRPAPWLPENLRRRPVSVAALHKVVHRARRYVGWAEAISHQRLALVTGHLGSRIVGALLLVPCASILIPLPLTNTVPGIGVAIVSIGLIERDGVMVIAGLAVGLLWVATLLIGGPAAIIWLASQFR